jgi:hypothetical protein
MSAPNTSRFVSPAADRPMSTASAMSQFKKVMYLEVAGYDEMFTAAGFGKAGEMAHEGANREELLRALPPEAAATVGLIGDADAVGARLEAYAVGLDEVVLVPATADDPGVERPPDGPGRARLTGDSGWIGRRPQGRRWAPLGLPALVVGRGLDDVAGEVRGHRAGAGQRGLAGAGMRRSRGASRPVRASTPPPRSSTGPSPSRSASGPAISGPTSRPRPDMNITAASPAEGRSSNTRELQMDSMAETRL